MNWVEIIWSMTAATCLTLAGVHLLVWLRARTSWVNLLFASSAVSVAVIAGFELTLMHSHSTAQFGTVQRWMHVPFWVLVVSLVWFLRLYLGMGRIWLAWTICGLRTAALILNFVSHPNLNFREIVRLEQMSLWGEMVSIPVVSRNSNDLVSCGLAVIVAKQPTESFAAGHFPFVREHREFGVDDFVLQPLMVSFRMIVQHELRGGSVQRGFADEDHSVKTRLLDGAYKPLRIRIEIG